MTGAESWIVAAKRTPFGRFGGSLKDVAITQLGAIAARAAIAQAGIAAEEIEQVIVGSSQVAQPGYSYVARHIGLDAGAPVRAPALMVNRLCGSGFQAVVTASEQILLGQAEVCLVVGADNMSQAPFVLRGARWGVPLGRPPAFEDTLMAGLVDAHLGIPMGATAETLATQHGLTRQDCDAYALRSHRAWKAAHDAGVFADELVPVEPKPGDKARTTALTADEHPRADASLEALARLPAVFKAEGVITAGNASGIGDGAAALVITSRAYAERRGLAPLARIAGWGIIGCDPRTMGLGPVPAIRVALDRAGLRLDQLGLVEVNEAFAPQYLAVERELALDRGRTNLDGGAIAIGHPLGATGARITAHLCYAMARRRVRHAVGSACIGGGQGIAVILEALGGS